MGTTSEKQMTLKEATLTLAQALSDDEELRDVYKAVVSMAVQDEASELGKNPAQYLSDASDSGTSAKRLMANRVGDRVVDALMMPNTRQG